MVEVVKGDGDGDGTKEVLSSFAFVVGVCVPFLPFLLPLFSFPPSSHLLLVADSSFTDTRGSFAWNTLCGAVF